MFPTICLFPYSSAASHSGLLLGSLLATSPLAVASLAVTLLAAPLGLQVASASSRAATVGLGLLRRSLRLGSGDTG